MNLFLSLLYEQISKTRLSDTFANAALLFFGVNAIDQFKEDATFNATVLAVGLLCGVALTFASIFILRTSKS